MSLTSFILGLKLIRRQKEKQKERERERERERANNSCTHKMLVFNPLCPLFQYIELNTNFSAYKRA